MKNKIIVLLACLFSKQLMAQNVGIGINVPPDKLSVVTTQQGYGISHTFGGVTLGTYLSPISAQFGTKTNYPLQFFTNNGSPQVTLLQNGNFGIGTIAPTATLDALGTVLSEGSQAGFRFNDRTDNTKGYQWYSTTGNAYLYRQQVPIGNAISILANGNTGLNIDVPQTDLHVNPAGAGSILIGTNKSSGGYTNLEMGITAQSGGNSYIQSTRSSGSAYGDLYLNPGSAYVGINHSTATTLFAPLDINQSSANRGIRLRNNVVALASYWDMYVNDHLNFSIIGFLQAFIGNDGSWNQVSDARLKTSVTKMENVLDKVMLLEPKKYAYKLNNPAQKISSGFVAQDVMEIFPEFVSDFKHPTSDTTDNTIYHGINYAGFSVVAIKAIQEQQNTIDAQNKRIEKLEKQMELLLKK